MTDTTAAASLATTYRVRFDETAPGNTLRTSTMLRYAQDVAWLHSESLGYDRQWYRDRGMAWLVRSVEMAVADPIQMAERLTVRTEVIGFRKVWARRQTDFRHADGSEAGWATIDWVLTDDEGRPRRVPEEFLEVFGGTLDSFAPIRLGAVRPSAEGPAPIVRHFAVRAHELDPMEHVNNATYLDYLEEGLAELDGGMELIRRLPRRYLLEYVVPAAAGMSLLATTWRDGTGGVYVLADKAGVELFRARLQT